mmetsp:Transcript_83845/g.227789  ORF Transcript_83845/g.227789 Transcript_83845/m.227789 type:complete len:93 (-) Transcript_83845:86-364(-)
MASSMAMPPPTPCVLVYILRCLPQRFGAARTCTATKLRAGIEASRGHSEDLRERVGKESSHWHAATNSLSETRLPVQMTGHGMARLGSLPTR